MIRPFSLFSIGLLEYLWSSVTGAHTQPLDRTRVRNPGFLSPSLVLSLPFSFHELAMGRYTRSGSCSRVRVCLEQGTGKLAVISTQPLPTNPSTTLQIAPIGYAILCSWNIAAKQTVRYTLSTRSTWLFLLWCRLVAGFRRPRTLSVGVRRSLYG